jgi:hypothetical protein
MVLDRRKRLMEEGMTRHDISGAYLFNQFK